MTVDKFVDNPRREAANADAKHYPRRRNNSPRRQNNSLLESTGGSYDTKNDITSIGTSVETRTNVDDDNRDLEHDDENTIPTYNYGTEEDYMADVGEMNCYCVPTRVYGAKDFMFRTLGWTLLNKEQILGAFTGKNRIILY